MAEIQKNLRPSTGKTWEKEFEAVDKTTKAYQDLLDEFTKYVETQRDFSNEGIDQFTTLLKNLDDVKDHWDDIHYNCVENHNNRCPILKEYQNNRNKLYSEYRDRKREELSKK